MREMLRAKERELALLDDNDYDDDDDGDDGGGDGGRPAGDGDGHEEWQGREQERRAE